MDEQNASSAPSASLSTLATSPARSSLYTGISDASGEIRYLIMRSARLVLSLAMEVLMFILLVPAVFAVFFSINYALSFGNIGVFEGTNPVFTFVGNHAIISMVVLVPAVLFLWVQCMAAGLPYRWSTSMPGLITKKCWSCGADDILDELYCSRCEAFRLGRVITAGVWCLSLVVTVAFVINDTLMILITVAGFAKGTRS